jgi:hypothetical protein
MEPIIGLFEPLWGPDLDGVLFTHQPDGAGNVCAAVGCRVSAIDDPETRIIPAFPEPVRLREQLGPDIFARDPHVSLP